MGVLAKRVIIHGAISRESGAETTTLLAATAGIQKKAYDAGGTSKLGGNGSNSGRPVAHSFRRVSNIDHGAGNGLTHNVPITASVLG